MTDDVLHKLLLYHYVIHSPLEAWLLAWKTRICDPLSLKLGTLHTIKIINAMRGGEVLCTIAESNNFSRLRFELLVLLIMADFSQLSTSEVWLCMHVFYLCLFAAR